MPIPRAPLSVRLRRALRPDEVWLLVQTVLLIPLTALSLRLFGYARTVAWLTATSPAAGHSPADRRAAAAPAVRALARAKRRAPYRGNCLSQSLTLWWLLGRRGLTPEIVIGAARHDGTFAAHAWVELDGIVLNDRADVAQRYRVLSGPPNYMRVV